MNDNFKVARLDAKMTLTDVAHKLDITRNTLSSWENGTTYPDVDYVLKLAELYNVSVDYLVGRKFFFKNNESIQIDSLETLKLVNAKPVYHSKLGWLLVNSTEKVLYNMRGNAIQFSEEILPLYFQAPNEVNLRLNNALKYGELRKFNEVMVEPIGSDKNLLQQVRGYYYVYEEYKFVENDRGIRFFFDTYGTEWLAFKI